MQIAVQTAFTELSWEHQWAPSNKEYQYTVWKWQKASETLQLSTIIAYNGAVEMAKMQHSNSDGRFDRLLDTPW